MIVFKRIAEFLFILLLASGIVFNEMVVYGIQQGYNQAKIIWNARPIDEVIADKNFPDSLKPKLRLIQEIRKFAFDSLGINYSGNYTTFFNQQGKTLVWVVTACEPYQFKAKEWWFPVLGNVPYKGFFDREKADGQAEELILQGYDVDIGRIGGWSTLGWFKDPILSNMLNNSEGELADLIIHELTHGTLYVKDSASFNENLASFIGHKGAVKFLQYRYGKNSKEDSTYMENRIDEKLFNEYILNGKQKLDSLYKNFTDTLSDVAKNKAKMNVIEKILKGLDSPSCYTIGRYKYYAQKALKSKNAFFMSFQRYDAKQDDIEKEFREKFNSDVKQYLQYLKSKYPSL